ncbi:MAG: outer membrane beta-barrel protein [Gemmatimonadetes bacterium]|nr:outer membrane beta-barrel protein [Gemmatimonadota bacterium]MYA11909.1 PorT family protein [Gemmatimonadota bacterium]MYE93345.1 PorT family protein [Gemmatimonadota bacterium]
MSQATRVIPIALFLLVHMPAAGQTSLAFSGGMNISSMDIGDESGLVPDVQSATGVSLGLAADFPLSETLGLRLVGRYSQKGGQFTISEGGEHIDASISPAFLDIAALGRLRFPLAENRLFLALVAGPAVGVAVSCDVDFGVRIVAGPSLNISQTCDEANLDWSSVDLGLAGGAAVEVQITDRFVASSGVLYTYGLVDMDTSSAASAHHRALTLDIGLGYAFR